MEPPSTLVDDALSVEDVVVECLLRHATLSNVDFAHLSNLSKRWRQASKRAILTQTTIANDHLSDSSTLLLLPSMVRYIMTAHSKDRIESGDDNDAAVATCDTFCAAWFHPDGIQELPIPLHCNINGMLSASDDDYSHTTSKSNVNTTFCPNGEAMYDNSDKDDDDTKGDGTTRSSRSSRKQLIRQEQNRSRSPATLSLSIQRNVVSLKNGTATTGSLSTDEPRIPTCNEWRGYQTAMDILSHFGYASSFVNDVISTVQSRHTSSSSTQSSTEGSTKTEIYKGSSGSRRNSPTKRRKNRETTYAVRGAIVSRPESYCDCIDTEIEKLRTLRFTTAAGNDTKELNNIRIQEYKQSIIRKEMRRRELQRDVLPRIITRLTPSRQNGNISGMRPNDEHQVHRCVQFLNANGGHAVCMLTPHFDCGPLTEPVTIFCVGIATEDGCFLSGLHRRFELGHLYPNSKVAELSEQSSVSIATDTWSTNCTDVNTAIHPNTTTINIVENDPMTYPIVHICEEDDDDRDGEEDDDDDDDDDDQDYLRIRDIVIQDDDDDSCDASCADDDEHLRRKCNCIFNGVGEKVAALDEGKPRIIHRGRLGPGAWHCYVAVFDGDKSVIRIDGVSETIQTEHPDSEKGTPTSQSTSKAMLDGLTIGSDHCFGMSLCCGNGSGGEGEGAIAELAVFQGRLDISDIEVLENDWMNRHRIPHLHSPSQDTVVEPNAWNENDFARQAHALFFLPETEDGTTSLPPSTTPTRIPLRFLSRHRSVAWKQTNPVTGEQIHIKRIGCKPGASSSDL